MAANTITDSTTIYYRLCVRIESLDVAIRCLTGISPRTRYRRNLLQTERMKLAAQLGAMQGPQRDATMARDER